MKFVHKKICTVVFLSACWLLGSSELSAAPDFGTLCRKGLGLVGGGIFIKGLWKAVNGRPVKGMSRMVSGTALAIASICSDIIYDRTVSLVRRMRELQQREAQAKQWSLRSLLQDVRYEADTSCRGRAVPVLSITQSKYELDEGLRACRNGNVFIGLDQIYDGLYHNIRARCRQALYPQA
jgi:hypothetical protein